MNEWKPITELEMAGMISEAESKMNASAHQIWELIRLSEPEKWELHPWGDEGGGFWVVAIAGKTCLYFNDIEYGFNSSSFKKWGVIDEYVCDQVELQDVMNGFVSISS